MDYNCLDVKQEGKNACSINCSKVFASHFISSFLHAFSRNPGFQSNRFPIKDFGNDGYGFVNHTKTDGTVNNNNGVYKELSG